MFWPGIFPGMQKLSPVKRRVPGDRPVQLHACLIQFNAHCLQLQC